MRLYNTLTKKSEELNPLEQGVIRMYSCGPTVYDHIHIGNLASFIYADTLRRTLKLSGVEVKHVMNFTDVDDKTIRRSQEKYSDKDPMDALITLTEEYSSLFLGDMKAVGNNIQDISFVKATQSVNEMQNIIRRLLEQKYAYHSDDGIYFSINAYKQSGKKYGQLTEVTVNSTSQARIENDEYDKESAHDFALWKKQKDNEPAWDFEVDGINLKGRPGWHIECSAMSKAELGQPFDIHTGGVDLIFPHHENEIAQSTAGSEDSVYASKFFHNEHLLIDGKKMSKSLNNFYTLETLKEKGFDPLAFRLLVLQARYSHQAHFSWENLESAQNRLRDLRAFSAIQFQQKFETKYSDEMATQTYDGMIQGQLREFSDDLDVPSALSLLSSNINHIENKGYVKEHIRKFIDCIDSLYGLDLGAVKDITDDQKQLLEAREQAREAKDWDKSDVIRGQLAEQGVGIRDTEHGPIWFPL